MWKRINEDTRYSIHIEELSLSQYVDTREEEFLTVTAKKGG